MTRVAQLRWLVGFAFNAAVAVGAAQAQVGVETATGQIVVYVGNGQSVGGLARDYGLTDAGHLSGTPNARIYTAGSAAAALRAEARLAADPRVRAAYAAHRNNDRTFAFDPNDPFFYPGANPPVGGPGDTGSATYPGQWHLENRMPAGANNNTSMDVRVRGAWNRDLTGNGVVVGIVDDAVQVLHPDLTTNNRPALSRDFQNNDNDPSPDGSLNHGTAVAGVAVARGNNGLGTTGAAPFAGLAGMRTSLVDVAVQNALAHENATIRVKNHSYGATGAYAARVAQEAALANSASLGAINVYAAGNSRGSTLQDANTMDRQNSPHAITVAATTSTGTFQSYSNFGACVFVSSPSGGGGFGGITTTDRTGNVGYNTTGSGNFASTAGGGTGLDYTNNFNGTSSSSPLVAGVLALAVQARDQAGFTSDVRVMKHLLARTSRVINAADATAASDGGWRTNAAGFRFNQNFGFGLIDADALTLAAVQYSGVTTRVVHTKATTTDGRTIPDANTTGISQSFAVATSGHLEEVLVDLSIAHVNRGDLEAFITSPSGYRSRLMFRSTDTADNIDWQMVSNAFWGEEVNGTWTVTVTDVTAANVGTWTNFAVTFHTGDLVPVPEPVSGGLLGFALVGAWAIARRRAAARR